MMPDTSVILCQKSRLKQFSPPNAITEVHVLDFSFKKKKNNIV